MTPFLLLLLVVSSELPAMRFGREVAKPADVSKHTYTKLHGVDVPTLATDNFVVTCLLYEDAEKIYVEAGIKNRSQQGLTLAADFMSIESGGGKLARIDTTKAAEQVERAAYKPFVPSATAKDTYDRDAVEQQGKAHIEQQEREVMFASLLLTIASEKAGSTLKAGGEQALACVFEQRKDRKAPLKVVMRVGGEAFVFSFAR